MSTRVVYEVRELAPGYFAYDVEVHPEGHRRTRQASGALRGEALAEQAAAQAIGALQVRLVGLGFEPLPVERRGLTPRRRRARRIAYEAGVGAARGLVLGLAGLGLLLIASAIW